MRVAWVAVPADAPRRDAAWALLRGLVPGAHLTNPCRLCGGPHGPVRVHGADVVASITYAAGWALVAVAERKHAAAIGIDAQERGYPGIDRVRGPGATMRDWVRVESVLKADGRGLRADPSLVDIRADGDTAIARVTDRDAVYRVQDVAGPGGLVVSVAVRQR